MYKTFNSTLQEYASSQLINYEIFKQGDYKVYVDNLIEEQSYRFTIMQRVLGKVLQDQTVICSVPLNNWQWFKSLFGLKIKCKNYNLTEHLTFPSIEWKDIISDKYTIYYDTGNYIHDEYSSIGIPK